MQPEAPPNKLALFDYKHTGRVVLDRQRKINFLLAMIGAMIAVKLLFPIGLIALAAPVVIYFGGERAIRIGARYLICSDRIVYFASLKSVTLSTREGTLALHSGGGNPFILERSRFREKGRGALDGLGQAESFKRVAGTILAHLRAANPTVDGLAEAEAELAA